MDKQISSSLITGGTSLAGAGLNILGGYLQNKWNKEQAAAQRSWEESMMDKQNAFSVDMWNKANEYNDPTHQMQRLSDAGLNPLFYGLDGSSTSGLQSAGVNGSSMPSMSNPFASVDPLTAAQVANLASQTRKNDADTGYQQALTATENALRQDKIVLAGLNIDLALGDIQLKDAQYKQLAQSVTESQMRCDQINNDIHMSWANYDMEKKKLCFEQSKFAFQKWLDQQKLNQAERELAISMYDANTRRLLADSEIEKNDWSGLLIQAQTANEEERKYNLIADRFLTQANTEARRYQTELDKRFGVRERRSGIHMNRAKTANLWVNSVNQSVDAVSKGLQLAYGKGFQLSTPTAPSTPAAPQPFNQYFE